MTKNTSSILNESCCDCDALEVLIQQKQTELESLKGQYAALSTSGAYDAAKLIDISAQLNGIILSVRGIAFQAVKLHESGCSCGVDLCLNHVLDVLEPAEDLYREIGNRMDELFSISDDALRELSWGMEFSTNILPCLDDKIKVRMLVELPAEIILNNSHVNIPEKSNVADLAFSLSDTLVINGVNPCFLLAGCEETGEQGCLIPADHPAIGMYLPPDANLVFDGKPVAPDHAAVLDVILLPGDEFELNGSKVTLVSIDIPDEVFAPGAMLKEQMANGGSSR